MKPCAHCGILFQPHGRGRHRYHSMACAEAAAQARHPDARRRKRPVKRSTPPALLPSQIDWNSVGAIRVMSVLRASGALADGFI